MQISEALDYLDGDELDELGFSLSDIGKAIGSVAKGAADIATFPARAVGGAIGGDVGRTISKVGSIAAAPAELAAAAALGGGGKKRIKTSAKGGGGFSSIGRKLGTALQTTSRAKKKVGSAAKAAKMRAMVQQQQGRSSLADKAALAAQLKPRIQAKSTRTPKPGATDPAVVAAVAAKVNARLAPKLSKIDRYLKLAADQRQATYEHDVIKNTAAYRRKVLGDLMRLSATLPADHPVRQRIVKVGLLSGLM